MGYKAVRHYNGHPPKVKSLAARLMLDGMADSVTDADEDWQFWGAVARIAGEKGLSTASAWRGMEELVARKVITKLDTKPDDPSHTGPTVVYRLNRDGYERFVPKIDKRTKGQHQGQPSHPATVIDPQRSHPAPQPSHPERVTLSSCDGQPSHPATQYPEGNPAGRFPEGNPEESSASPSEPLPSGGSSAPRDSGTAQDSAFGLVYTTVAKKLEIPNDGSPDAEDRHDRLNGAVADLCEKHEPLGDPKFVLQYAIPAIARVDLTDLDAIWEAARGHYNAVNAILRAWPLDCPAPKPTRTAVRRFLEETPDLIPYISTKLDLVSRHAPDGWDAVTAALAS